jgi:hypothetical protein
MYMKIMRSEWIKPGTPYKIRFFREDDVMIKQISSEKIIVYEQIIYDYDESYERETCEANGFQEADTGRCIVQ